MCELIQWFCPPLAPFQHGNVSSPGNRTVLDSVRYECGIGYLLRETSGVELLPGEGVTSDCVAHNFSYGIWSNPEPACSAHTFYCPELSVDPNGFINYTDTNRTIYSAASYGCTP
eukprot:885511_1